MNLNIEKCIDFYSGEYKNGIFAKKHNIKLYIYPSYICLLYTSEPLAELFGRFQ